MSLDAEIRAAERARDWPLVARLRRRRGEGPIVLGDEVVVVCYLGAGFSVDRSCLVGQTGRVIKILNTPWLYDGRGSVSGPGYLVLGPYASCDPASWREIGYWLGKDEIRLL